MHKETTHTFLPVALNITEKKILIIGGGNVGFHKASILSRYTQHAFVISPEFRDEFADLPFVCIKRAYKPTDLDDAFLVYVCTEDEKLNRRIFQDAAKRGVLVSVCDNPSLCDFISPAIYQNDNICIAVTSNAREVKRSIRIRDRIKDWVSSWHEAIE